MTRRLLELTMVALLGLATVAWSHLAPPARCTSWTKTGPITNTAAYPIQVRDSDHVLNVRLDPGQRVQFRETLSAATYSHTDHIFVNDAPVDMTMTRPESCR